MCHIKDPLGVGTGHTSGREVLALVITDWHWKGYPCLQGGQWVLRAARLGSPGRNPTCRPREVGFVGLWECVKRQGHLRQRKVQNRTLQAEGGVGGPWGHRLMGDEDRSLFSGLQREKLVLF